jgi:hypothetical protein
MFLDDELRFADDFLRAAAVEFPFPLNRETPGKLSWPG